MSQDRRGAGVKVARQERACRELASKFGWDVVAVYIDNDVSASTGRPRPGYLRLLESIRAGQLDVVLAWHTDRLHRRPIELEEYLSCCEPRGVATYTVEAGELDLATPSGRAMARTFAAWARFEVEHKASRTVAGMREAGEQGKWLGGRGAFGWDISTDPPTIRQDEAAAIRRGARDLLAHKSLSKIASDWNAAGLRGTLGATFGATTVRQVLLRPRNAGIATYKGEELGSSPFPAILDEPQWRSVVALLNSPNRPGIGTDNRAKYLLSGLARCQCGDLVGSAHVQGPNGASRVVYRCRTRGSGHVGKNQVQVDALVSEVMIARLSLPDALAAIARSEPVDSRALLSRAEEIKSSLDQLAVAHGAGQVTLSQMVIASGGLRKELDGVLAKLSALTPAPEAVRILAATTDVRASWESLPLREKRQVIGALCEVRLLRADPTKRRRFDPNTVKIDWHTPAPPHE